MSTNFEREIQTSTYHHPQINVNVKLLELESNE